MAKKKQQIDWDKSYFLTAEQVVTLGLEGISVNNAAEAAERNPDA